MPSGLAGGWQANTGVLALRPLSKGMNKKMKLRRSSACLARVNKLHLWLLISVNILVMSCATTSTTTGSRRQTEEPRGFFGSLMDEITERECNVGRFTCPYGLGRAGEPCTCTEPSGIVLNGRTVK